MFQKIIAWFTKLFSKKPIVVSSQQETVLGIPDEPESDIQRKARDKRERRRKRNLSHTSHRSNDDRQTMGATGSIRRNRE